MFAYPVPAAGLVTIGCLNNRVYNRVLLEIYDVAGKKLAVQEASFSDAVQTRFIYDAGKLPPGTYFFTITADNKKHTGKFIKK